MSDHRSKEQCELIVGGIKKVCHEKHVGVNQRFKNMEDLLKSINNKFILIMVTVITEIIVIVALKIFKG